MIPGLGRSPGEGNGNPLLYSCLENSMDRGAWWATVHGITKEWDMTEMTEHTSRVLSQTMIETMGRKWEKKRKNQGEDY